MIEWLAVIYNAPDHKMLFAFMFANFVFTISHIAGVIFDSLYPVSRGEIYEKSTLFSQDASFNIIKFEHKKSA